VKWTYFEKIYIQKYIQKYWKSQKLSYDLKGSSFNSKYFTQASHLQKLIGIINTYNILFSANWKIQFAIFFLKETFLHYFVNHYSSLLDNTTFGSATMVLECTFSFLVFLLLMQLWQHLLSCVSYTKWKSCVQHLPIYLLQKMLG